MTNVPETTTQNKPHRSRERIYEDALKAVQEALRHGPDDVTTAVIQQGEVHSIIHYALQEANTCEVCGWLGTAEDPVIEYAHHRRFRLCQSPMACADRRRTEVRA